MKNKTTHKATVIEFVGPPGAGKTTSAQYFADVLQAKGVKVMVLQELKEYIYRMGMGAKLYLIASTAALHVACLLSYTSTLARHRIYSYNSVYRYLRLLIFNKALHRFLRKSQADVVLLDQWMIQELWSATIFKNSRYDKLPGKLSRYMFETDIKLYFDIDLATAAERIENRASNLSRFDKMDAGKRMAKLEQYNDYLLKLYEHAACSRKHKLHTSKSLEDNAALFMAYLQQPDAINISV